MKEIINDGLETYNTQNSQVGWKISRAAAQYLGKNVVCHDVKPGWDDRRFCYSEEKKSIPKNI